MSHEKCEADQENSTADGQVLPAADAQKKQIQAEAFDVQILPCQKPLEIGFCLKNCLFSGAGEGRKKKQTFTEPGHQTTFFERTGVEDLQSSYP